MVLRFVITNSVAEISNSPLTNYLEVNEMYTYIMFSGKNVYVERTEKKDPHKYIHADVVLRGSSVVKNRFNIDEDKLLEIAKVTDISDIEIPREPR